MKRKDVEKLLLEAYRMGQASVSCKKVVFVGEVEFPGDSGNAKREMVRKLLSPQKEGKDE